MPDVLEDAGPGRHSDACADQDGDLVVEDILRGGPVRAVDAERRHLLAVLERDLIHAHGIQGVVFFGLGRARTQSVSQSAGEVSDLPDVHRYVRVVRAGSDGEGVPLRAAHGGYLEEKPLSRFVFHVGFFELDLERVVRVADDFGDSRRAPGLNGAVDALDQINASGDELPSPAVVADAVVPEVSSCEGGIGHCGVADETAGGVRVHCQEEGDEKVVGVVEGFETLLTDLVVRGGEHEEHAQEHDVSGYSSGLRVMYLYRGHGPELCALDVEKIHVMRTHMDNGEDEDRVCDLAVEPLGFVQREPADFGADVAKECTAHGKKDEKDVDGEHEAGASGEPDGEGQGVEAG